MTDHPQRPNGVYYDTTVLIDMEHAFDGSWRPTPGMGPQGLRLLAAARLRFYTYESYNGWWPVTSTEAYKEVLAGSAHDWLTGFIFLVDGPGTRGPTAREIAEQAARFQQSEPGMKLPDARHLAFATLNPWIGRLVTSDLPFLKRGRRLSADLVLSTSIEAAASPIIDDGQSPPIGPAAGSSLEGQSWWVPTRDLPSDLSSVRSNEPSR